MVKEVSIYEQRVSPEMNEKLDDLEVTMNSMEQKDCPVNHLFVEGAYARQIFMKAGTLIISQIHKTQHFFVVTQGSAMVKINDDKWIKVEAPYYGVTNPGTRRVLYILEDCVWTTYHATTKNNVSDIADEILEKHDLSPSIKKLWPGLQPLLEQAH